MICLKVDNIKVQEEQQYSFPLTEKSLVDRMKEKINFLYTHNKNLTKEQWYAVCELESIINNIRN